MTGPTIRPAASGDIAAITAIYAHAVQNGTASFELSPPDMPEMTRRWQEADKAGHPYLVAEIAGTVVGYGYARPYRPRPAYRWTVEDSIYVDPDHAGRGVGRALLTALIAEATAAGYRQMMAVIGGSDHTASIALHRVLGFHHAGTLRAVGFKHGQWQDTVLMQRALGPGAGQPPDKHE